MSDSSAWSRLAFIVAKVTERLDEVAPHNLGFERFAV